MRGIIPLQVEGPGKEGRLGMGLYKRKGSQFYWMTFRVNGRKYSESTRTSNRKLAEKIYAKTYSEMLEGKWIEPEPDLNITMAEMIDRFMVEISPHLATSTHERNVQMAKNLKGFFGKMLVQEVRSSTVSKYKAKKLKAGYRKETIVRELGFLRRIYNVAIEEWEICKDNPVRNTLKTLGRSDRKRVRFLSAEEVTLLMGHLTTWLKPIVILARHTGLRRGNILSLTWDQIDLKRRVLLVNQTKNGEPIGIPLTETACMTLNAQVGHLHSPYVFCDREGQPYSPHKISMAFRRACKRAGIENLRFHDLRHDFASKIIQRGGNIYALRELLGHKDMRMTVRYAHLAPENLREAVNVLESGEDGYILATVGDKEKGLHAVTP